MFWTICLYTYCAATGISLLILPVPIYYFNRDREGKRKSILFAILSGLICLIPIINLIFLIMGSWAIGKDFVEKWIDNDPSSPQNKNNPNFVPPVKKEPKPKKEKKYKPIKTRSEILDL